MALSHHQNNATHTTLFGAAPHIVFILVDDWGANDATYRQRELRPTEEPSLRTPSIDALAASGMRLNSYYVQHICSPTRTSLLSGRYQIHTGLQDGIIQAWARVCLPPKFPTLANAFRSLGYSTHAVGKWHGACLHVVHLLADRLADRSAGRSFGRLPAWQHIFCRLPCCVPSALPRLALACSSFPPCGVRC